MSASRALLIALVDYGAGNLTSVAKGLTAVGAEVRIARVHGDLTLAAGVVVPGVGHFGATKALDDAWRKAISNGLREGRPLLGICLGMQWLFTTSDEAPDIAGLGVLDGRCVRINGNVKVPHVGWNALQIARESNILSGVADGAQVYFTHSYAAPVTEECVATTTHGDTFATVVERGHVSGVQFHPEKSGTVGLTILKNFIERCAR